MKKQNTTLLSPYDRARQLFQNDNTLLSVVALMIQEYPDVPDDLLSEEIEMAFLLKSVLK